MWKILQANSPTARYRANRIHLGVNGFRNPQYMQLMSYFIKHQEELWKMADPAVQWSPDSIFVSSYKPIMTTKMFNEELGRQAKWRLSHDGQERPVRLSTNIADHEIVTEAASRRRILQIPPQQILSEFATSFLQAICQLQYMARVKSARGTGQSVDSAHDPRLYIPESGVNPALPRPIIYPMKSATRCHPGPEDQPPNHG